MSQKKTVLNEVDVEKGVKDGRFIESGTQIREVSSGQIVKVINKKEISGNSIPSTIIQIHHSYVYQADLRPIFDAIAHARENNIYEELEEQYNLALDYFDSYNTYGNNIEKVHQVCLEISVSFDNKIRIEIDDFDISNIEKKDIIRFEGSLSAYVKILFSYIVSTYILHREKFSNEKVIIKKILSFENNLRSLYEQLLAESKPKKQHDGRTIEEFSMEHSLYSMYMFDDSYDIKDLEALVSQDRRFSSALQVVGFFKEYFKTGCFNNQNWRYGSRDDEMKIRVSTDRISPDSKRAKLAKKLYLILGDLDKLKAIREEMVNLKDVTDKDILTQIDDMLANKQNQADA